MKKFIPTFTEHLARYVFALTYCYKKKVLDCGAKDGDCSILLSYSANDLTLADISKYWLGCAKGNPTYKCPAHFVLCDFEKDFPEGEWDTIVAFETVEHIANVDFFIKNIADHLKPGGLFVFSVPHMVANREHKTLFNEESIKALVSKYLTLTEFYKQDTKIISGKPTRGGLLCYVGVARKEH